MLKMRRSRLLWIVLAAGTICLGTLWAATDPPPAPSLSELDRADANRGMAIIAAAPIPVIGPPTAVDAPVHRFWDPTNILLFSGVAITRGLDYASTRNFEARGRKEILLPQDVVDDSAGFASIEAAATATSVGLSYWLHRTGHHSLERWLSITHMSVTAFGDARNYALKTKHPHQP